MEVGVTREGTLGFVLNQVELSNILRRYWTDLVHWTRAIIVTTLFDLENKASLEKRLMRNAEDIANVFGVLYGDDLALRVERLLKDHYATLISELDALQVEDMEAAGRFHTILYQQLDELAELLASVNSNIDKAALQVMLYELLSLTEQEAVLFHDKQYDESIEQYDKIYDQALRIADDLAYAIIRQIRI